MAEPARLEIPNRQARWLWLDAQGLSEAPVGGNTLGIIQKLGFVQLDTIQVVSRAHHHILWSRQQSYREPMLDRLLARDRAVFEHFTHDASVLPMETLPMWRRQFRRKVDQIVRSGWYKSMLDADGRAAIRQRIAQEGPLSTHAFDTKVAGEKEMWARPPHKLALDFMWYGGELATCHRNGFTKVYDLAERVFPPELHGQEVDDAAQVAWLCDAALERLGFGVASDIKKFWEAVDLAEVKAWMEGRNDLVPVSVQSRDGSWVDAVAPPDIEGRLARLAQPTSRLRILNPFDPVIRDRTRLERLFGFAYRVEMFVPAAKRQWGYYIYPLLEGDRMVGRLEVKAERAADRLVVSKLWAEPRVKWTAARAAKLDAELQRLARLAGVAQIAWTCANAPL